MDDIKKTVIIDVQTNADKATADLNNLSGELKSTESIFGKFGSVVTKSLSSIGTAFKKLMANPYLAAIGAALAIIIAAFNKLKEAIQKNDNASTGLARAFAVLKTPLKVIENVIASLADWLGKVASKAADAIKWIYSMIPALGKIAEEQDRLVTGQDELEDAEREYARNHAKRAAQIAELEEKAADTEEYSAKQRKQYYDEAKALYLKDYNEHQKLIKRKIAQKRLEMKVNKDSSDQAKNELTDLYDKSHQVYAEYEKTVRNTNRKVRQINRQTASEYQQLVKQQTEEIEKRDKEIRSSNDQNVASNKAANDTILRVHRENIRLQIKALEDGVKAIKDKNVDMAQASVDYINKVYENAFKIEDLETKMKEANLKADQYAAEITDTNIKLASETNETIKKSLQERLTVLTQGFNSQLNLVSAYSEQIKKYEDANINASFDYYNKLDELDEKFAKQRADLLKAQAPKLNIKEQAEKEVADLNKALQDSYDNQRESLEIQLDILQDLLNSKILNEEQYNEQLVQVLERREKTEDQYNKDMIAAEEEAFRIRKEARQEYLKDQVNAASQMLGSFAQVASSIASAYEAEYQRIVEGKEELSAAEAQQAIEALERQKAATIANLALQQAQSIGYSLVAAASAASMSGVAAPFVYAATAASLLAGIISGFVSASNAIANIDAQIEEVKSKVPKYATGGYIQGAGTGTSDSISARLSNGEAVINARSTARFYDLLSAINQAGGGVAFPNTQSVPQMNFAQGGVAQNYDNIYTMMQNAVANIQPVVSVKEITKVQNRLKTKEII